MTCVLAEAHDEWQVAERRTAEESMAGLNPPVPTAIINEQEVIDTAALRTA